jgi:arginine-tRNA-protein transferase
MELQFRLADELIAVSVIDCGQNSVSAVYTYFDPDYSKLSLGTYAILKQIEFCVQTGRQFVYLGMFVKDNRHLSYKARFLPQQRWIAGDWVDFDDNSG